MDVDLVSQQFGIDPVAIFQEGVRTAQKLNAKECKQLDNGCDGPPFYEHN